jgi:hypothetical protein
MHAAFLVGGFAELAGALIAVIWFRRNSLETPRAYATARPEHSEVAMRGAE